MISRDKCNENVYGRRQTRRTDPIPEEQLLEIKLIESSFLLNNSLKIIVSFYLFCDETRHRCILALF